MASRLLVTYGARRAGSPDPCWNSWGVTAEDPDGYRIPLSARD
ncbi:hypothetical protein ACGH2B_01545 [Streptomyces sp. BBFR2]